MKANRALQRRLGVLVCAILSIVLVACSPIMPPPPEPEAVSLPSEQLQSIEEYEHANAIDVLEKVAEGADPATADVARQAVAELTAEEGEPREPGVNSSTLDDRVVNGIPTARWPAVGVMLNKNSTGYYQTWCTATLIGCDTVLTAAHCVDHNPQPQDLRLFFHNAGFVNVTEIHSHPDFDFPNADVAVLRLEHAVDGIRPETINYTDVVGVNITGTIVGFGRSGGALFDYGIKRYGSITTASCTGNFSNDNLICWNFTAPIGPAGTDSNTCNADSGGPLFSPSPSGGYHLSGVTSGGIRSSCLAGDHSYDARVSRYSDWIVDNSGALGGDSCGELPAITNDLVNDMVEVGYSTLGITATQKTHFFQVQPGTQLLRITMNGEDTGINNFNLYVRAGAEPDLATSTYDCASTNSWQYEVCEIANPTPGTWFALVRRDSGAGQYQVVATTYGQ